MRRFFEKPKVGRHVMLAEEPALLIGEIRMFVSRPVSSFRFREDFSARVTSECAKLGCSKGVYFEILLAKAWEQNLITSDDVISYDPTVRWLDQAINSAKNKE